MFKNKEGKVRSGWKIVIVMLIALGISALFSLLIGIVISVIVISSGNYNIASDAYLNRVKELITDLKPLLMLIQESIVIAVPILAWKLAIKRPLSNMGLTHIKTNKKDFFTGLLFGIVSISIVFLALILSGNAAVETWTPRFSIMQIAYLGIFISVGFAEEILGRGFIMSVLRQTRSGPAIIIISSIIFSLLHSSNDGIGIIPYINLVLAGILFGYMYLMSGNIWMCIGYHITWNYFQGNVFGFKVSGINTEGILATSYDTNNIFNGGAFGPEGGLFVTAVILAGFLFVRYYYKDKKFDFLAMEPETQVLHQPEQPEIQQTNDITL